MRTVPRRGVVPVVLTLLLLAAMGPPGAFLVAAWVTPDSPMAQVVPAFIFLFPFFVGLLLWMGAGLVSGMGHFLRGLVSGRPPDSPSGDETVVPPGYSVFLWLCVSTGLATGLAVAPVSELTLLTGPAVWGGYGLLFGGIAYQAAHHGYLPFPEDD